MNFPKKSVPFIHLQHALVKSGESLYFFQTVKQIHARSTSKENVLHVCNFSWIGISPIRSNPQSRTCWIRTLSRPEYVYPDSLTLPPKNVIFPLRRVEHRPNIPSEVFLPTGIQSLSQSNFEMLRRLSEYIILFDQSIFN